MLGDSAWTITSSTQDLHFRSCLKKENGLKMHQFCGIDSSNMSDMEVSGKTQNGGDSCSDQGVNENRFRLNALRHTQHFNKLYQCQKCIHLHLGCSLRSCLSPCTIINRYWYDLNYCIIITWAKKLSRMKQSKNEYKNGNIKIITITENNLN